MKFLTAFHTLEDYYVFLHSLIYKTNPILSDFAHASFLQPLIIILLSYILCNSPTSFHTGYSFCVSSTPNLYNQT